MNEKPADDEVVDWIRKAVSLHSEVDGARTLFYLANAHLLVDEPARRLALWLFEKMIVEERRHEESAPGGFTVDDVDGILTAYHEGVGEVPPEPWLRAALRLKGVIAVRGPLFPGGNDGDLL